MGPSEGAVAMGGRAGNSSDKSNPRCHLLLLLLPLIRHEPPFQLELSGGPLLLQKRILLEHRIDRLGGQQHVHLEARFQLEPPGCHRLLQPHVLLAIRLQHNRQGYQTSHKPEPLGTSARDSDAFRLREMESFALLDSFKPSSSLSPPSPPP